VDELLTGEKITQVHRGLLPFRVWQIYQAMVKYVEDGDAGSFVCAAGVLTHYVGDACQPLHISYLHDGDPLQPITRTRTKKGVEVEVTEPSGKGVHGAYEDAMINAHRDDVLDALKDTPKVKSGELINSGFDAAKRTIALMHDTFKAIAPASIVDAYVNHDRSDGVRAEVFWEKFGDKTIECMQDGTHLLAVLWQSAWVEGKGSTTITATAITEKEAMKICGDADFLPSRTIANIGKFLK
jgi:hypothetical protein